MQVHGQQLDAPEAVEAIPELERDQTTNLAVAAGYYRMHHDAGLDAVLIQNWSMTGHCVGCVYHVK